MSGKAGKEGFMLLVALGSVLVVAVVVGAVVGHVAQSTRQMRTYLAKSRCRFAAQSAVEEAKALIQSGFSAYLGVEATAVKIDPKFADAYNWFDNVSADRCTIGITDAKHDAVTLVDPPDGVNGCTVVVRIGRSVDHTADSPVAYVPVVATATYAWPDGLSVSATIQETVCFATGQSQVFNYAYFVNNYGWMNGTSICINGDMRANGDVSLSGSTVNGFVYAAVNDEVGATGKVTLKSSPKIRNQSSYRSNATNRARPDYGEYRTSGAYDAPSSTGTIVKPVYDAVGNVLSGTVGASSGMAIVQEAADPIPMPFVSYLNDYIEFAQEKAGTLSYPSVNYTDSAGNAHTVPAGIVNAHFNGAGPSQDQTLADKGALVLVGTATNPIRINGPVVVDSDVIIKGYVTGQGTIYSGRNIHIIGSINYLNAPSWNHPDSDPAAVESSNATKDLLGLVAKGNIVVGDSSSSSWYSSVKSYIDGGYSSVVEQYACDESDAAIGYPAVFGGSYTVTEKVTGLSAALAASAPGGWNSSNGQFGKVRLTELDTTHTVTTTTYDRWGRPRTTTTEVRDTALATNYDRKYYETVCDDAVITSLKDSSGISRIDAVLYNNHGIFGTPGQSGVTFNLNGSLVCRDEALIFSGNGINFNWDMRLKPRSNNAVTAGLGLPVGVQDPFVLHWQEVPESLNPAFDEEEP